ncbi:sulfurtransferase TusA family protein, partial [Endobacter medicaginis]
MTTPALPIADTILDLRGLACPLPVLKANRRLRELGPGARL